GMEGLVEVLPVEASSPDADAADRRDPASAVERFDHAAPLGPLGSDATRVVGLYRWGVDGGLLLDAEGGFARWESNDECAPTSTGHYRVDDGRVSLDDGEVLTVPDDCPDDCDAGFIDTLRRLHPRVASERP